MFRTGVAISAFRNSYAWYVRKMPKTNQLNVNNVNKYQDMDESTSVGVVPFPPQAQVLTYQQAIGALVMSSASVVCCWSDSARTARHFITAIAVMDYVHIYATYLGVGPDVFWNPREWNHMLWGDVVVTMVFNVLRWSTVLGVFGGTKRR